MLRRSLWVSFYILLVTSTVVMKVKGLPQSAERLLDVPNYVGRRIRRSAVDFHRLIRCYQPTINVLGTYGNYGCFCGFSGTGSPIDETDKCCEIHDRCYSDAGEMDKGFWDKVVSAFGHIVPTYNFKCENGIAACEPDSAYRRKLCECDSEAAACFHRASATFHPQLQEVDTSKYCVANAKYDDLNLTEYENRYVPLNALTSTKTVSSTKASKKEQATIKSHVKTKEDKENHSDSTSAPVKSKAKQLHQNLLVTPQTNTSGSLGANPQATINGEAKSAKQNRSETTRNNDKNKLKQSGTLEQTTVLTPPSSDLTLNTSSKLVDKSQSKSNSPSKNERGSKSETKVTATPELSSTAENVKATRPSEEKIVFPKIVHPKERKTNRSWTEEKEFDVKDDSQRSKTRHRKPHVHKNKPEKTNRDDKSPRFDVETDFDLSNSNTKLPKNNPPEYPSGNRSNDSLVKSTRIDGSDAQSQILGLQASVLRQNSDPNFSSTIRPSFWNISSCVCLVFFIFHNFEFLGISNL